MGSTDDNKKISFEEVFEKYRELVAKITLNILKNYELAEDAFQATFCTVAKNMSKLDEDPQKTKNYISKIAHNKALKLWKKDIFRRLHETAFTDEESLCAELENRFRPKDSEFIVRGTEDEIIRKIEKERLLKALDGLDKKYSAYIREYYFDGLTFKKIAENHDISLEAAQKKVYRGIEKLRMIFFGKGNNK